MNTLHPVVEVLLAVAIYTLCVTYLALNARPVLGELFFRLL